MKLNNSFKKNITVNDNMVTPKLDRTVMTEAASKRVLFNEVLHETVSTKSNCMSNTHIHESGINSTEFIKTIRTIMESVEVINEAEIVQMMTANQVLINKDSSDMKSTEEQVSDTLDYIKKSFGDDSLNNVVNELIKWKEAIELKKDGIAITDTNDIVTDIDVNKSLTENANGDDETSNYWEISQDFFNEKDADELIKKIQNLRLYFNNIINSKSAVSNCDMLLRYLFHKFIRNVSYIRRFVDTLNECLSLVDVRLSGDTIHLKKIYSLIENKIAFCNNHVDNLITESTNFEYSILMELGMDDVFDAILEVTNYSETLLENGVLNENFTSVKVAAKEKFRRANQKQKRISRGVDNKFQRVLDDYRRSKKDDTQDSIIKSTFKVSKLLKSAIAAIGVFAIPNIGPALALIGVITKFAINAKTKGKYKQALLNDLKAELKIVNEKRSDADRKGDDKAKYKLMRLENELERSIDKIKYNIKDSY